jgi:cell division protein FtsL
LLLISQSREARYRIGEIILIVMILSAALGIVEMVFQQRLMP